jgi:hypothetical protein
MTGNLKRKKTTKGGTASEPRVVDMLVLDGVRLRVAQSKLLHLDLEGEVLREAAGLEEVSGLEVEAGYTAVAP